MATAVDAMDHVMQLQAARGPTSGHAAATSIATPHQSRDARRNVLVGARRRIVVDRSEVLRVARRALDRGRAAGDLGTGAVLPALASPGR